MMEGRDRISELPADILDKILVFLPIVEAARMAVLSTLWRDIWFSLTELDFDSRFGYHIEKKYSPAHCDILTHNIEEVKKNNDFWTSVGLYVINKVLIKHRGGLIRKFVFDFKYDERNTLRSRSFEFNEWLLFVTRKGVEEIELSLKAEDEYRLPNCILSCPTLRELYVYGVSVEPINAHCTLPNVTSLCFDCVDFWGDLSVDAPMLNNLRFVGCVNMSDFNIAAQKLDSLAINWCHSYQLPVNLNLCSVRNLELDSSSVKDVVNGFTRRGLQLQPPVLNVEYLMLSTNNELTCDNSSAFIHLLWICPKLCKLKIELLFSDDLPKLLELLRAVDQRHKMLHTLKLKSFKGGEDQTLFIKGLLALFPALVKVVITPEPISNLDENYEKSKEEVLQYPCASTEAKIIFKIPRDF